MYTYTVYMYINKQNIFFCPVNICTLTSLIFLVKKITQITH